MEKAARVGGFFKFRCLGHVAVQEVRQDLLLNSTSNGAVMQEEFEYTEKICFGWSGQFLQID
jgi:hypothetical protein